MANTGRMVKESIVQELASTLAGRSNFFVTAVSRLPAAEADAFRQKLSTSQARLIMVKRRLGQRAIEPLKLSGLAELLEGSVAFVLPEADVLPTAKLIVDFVKAHEEQVAVRGAVIDGQILDKARVEQLASLPPKPVLLAHVVFTIESPMTDVIFTLEQLIGELAWVTEQAAAKKPAEATPAAAAPQPETPTTPTPEAGPSGAPPDKTPTKQGEGTTS